MFEVYDFSAERPKRGRPRKDSPKTIKEALSFAIGWRRTIVGCYNIRLVGCTEGTVVTLSPQEFVRLFPDATVNAASGVAYLSVKRAEELGFTFARTIEEMTIA
ncbi:hypothetical protein [Brevibacillus reuszeri]|uniref:hypothetical protein n=1 Tax=Brevibacillus reuszeri TaxID=54915 RepID=UPI000CCC1CEA|nr:hypothetical protein [Brevibacillus reuszeri]